MLLKMYHDKSIIAIIPARGGSKRLPQKNIKSIAGKPLIVWSIEAGLKSRYIDKIVVSSDDEHILKMASAYGAETLKRPQNLATDTATSYDVMVHVLEHYPEYDYIVMLQPTSPLRTSWHIDDAVEYLHQKNGEGVISVCENEHSPLWSNTLPANMDMSTFLPQEIQTKRSQDLPVYYRLNGAIYICSVEKLLETKTLFLPKGLYGYVMPREVSVDIDTQLDFDIAEMLLLKSHG